MPKTIIPEFKDALQLIWSALLQKASLVTLHCERLTFESRRVSQRWTF